MNTKNYFLGYVLSLAFTLAAFALVMFHALSPWAVVAEILILALLQCAVQLACFLHLGEGQDARERAFVLGAAALVVLILVSGSLWIMTHLNARMMQDPNAMQQYMDDQSGL